MLPWLAIERSPMHAQRHRALGAILYSAIGSMLLAYAGWSYVVTRLGAARAGVDHAPHAGDGRRARGTISSANTRSFITSSASG